MHQRIYKEKILSIKLLIGCFKTYMFMKEKFICIANKILLPMCVLMITFSLLRDYINLIPYIYLLPFRIILFLGAIAIVLLGFIKPIDKTQNVIYKGNSLKEFFYFNSSIIIERFFYYYFGLYIILRLDKLSIIFSFIMLFILGVYCGSKITNTTHYNYKK